MRIPKASIAIAAACLFVSGCAAPPGQSGVEADPFTLAAVFGNSPGGIGSDVLSELAETEGLVDVEDPRVPPGERSDEEGNAIAALLDGSADISVIRADRLVGEGAGSLAALQAANVVLSDAQAQAIAADAELTAGLMSGLPEIGLVGLAIVPGGIRYPFGYHEPLLTLADWNGAVINTRVGPGVEAIINALGGTVDHSVENRSELAMNGGLRGIEVALQQVAAVDRPAVLTTNVPLYAKFDVVVIRADVYEALADGQRAALGETVSEAIESVASRRERPTGILAEWCQLTGSSAMEAPEADVEAIRDRLDAVTEALASDPDAASAIARMRELGEGHTPDILFPCEAKPVEDWAVQPEGDQHVLDGTWRVEANRQDLIDAGVDDSVANANAGLWTFVIDNGVADIEDPDGGKCRAQFSFAGERVSIDWGLNTHCSGHSVGSYRIEGDTVYFTFDGVGPNIDAAMDNAFFLHGLVRAE